MSIKHGENGLPIGSGLYWKREKIYAAIRVNGTKHVFNTGTAIVRDAVKFAEDKKADLTINNEAIAKRGVTVQELFDDYVERLKAREQRRGAYMTDDYLGTPSYKTKNQIDNNLAPVFGKLKPEEVTTARLNKYAKDRSKAGAKPVTVNRELSYLRTALKLGAKCTPRKVNPLQIASDWSMIDIEAEKAARRTGTITPEQYESIMSVAADHLKPIIATAMHTGIRSKEMKFIRPEQVDFKSNVISLRAGETKNRTARIVPIINDLRPVLLAWQKQTEKEYPNAERFFHFEGKKLGNAKTAWNAALRRAGLRIKENDKWVNLVMFHDTRRTAITAMDQDGVSEADMQLSSGHKTPEVIRAYNQSKQAVERVRTIQNAARLPKATDTPAVAPQAANGDWKAELKELKSLLDGGILTADEFATEKARVLASR